ncbi:hypothetical protein [Kaarinaea lacus]
MLAKLNSFMHRIDESGKQMGQSAYQMAMISHTIRPMKNSIMKNANIPVRKTAYWLKFAIKDM